MARFVVLMGNLWDSGCPTSSCAVQGPWREEALQLACLTWSLLSIMMLLFRKSQNTFGFYLAEGERRTQAAKAGQQFGVFTFWLPRSRAEPLRVDWARHADTRLKIGARALLAGQSQTHSGQFAIYAGGSRLPRQNLTETGVSASMVHTTWVHPRMSR